MDAALEIAIAGEHRRYDQAVFLDGAAAVWGSSALWGSAAVWGTSGTQANSAVWGSAAIWGGVRSRTASESMSQLINGEN